MCLSSHQLYHIYDRMIRDTKSIKIERTLEWEPVAAVIDGRIAIGAMSEWLVAGDICCDLGCVT